MRFRHSQSRRSFVGDVRADHAQLQYGRARYDLRFKDQPLTSTAPKVLMDLVTHVGFQQLAVFRLASTLHRRGMTPLAMVITRIIRHLYAAEMHWAADIEPGVVLVHGNGLVISREARVGSGCVLSQNVTLGLSRGRDGVGGAPHLVGAVHVGPGAALLGPITVGPDVKIMANTVVMESVRPRMTVAAPSPSLVPRP